MWNRLKNKVVSTLRWSEQYTKTDMVYLAKGGGWLSIGKVVSVVGGLALATAFANLIPQETYGTYKYVVSAASIIGVFTLSDIGTAITQAVARGFEGSLRKGAKEKLKWSIGIVLVGLGVAAYYYLQGNVTLALGMGMIAVFYPIQGYGELYRNFLEGKKDFKRAGIYHSMWEAFEVIAMVATLFLTENVLWVLLVFFASNAIAPMVFYFRTLNIYQPSDEFHPETLTYGKHLSVMSAFNKVASQIDKVLVWHFLGPIQLAIYSFSTLPVDKSKTLLSSLQNLALPKFSEKPTKILKKTLPRKVLIFAVICATGVLAFIITAPYIYQILFPEYIESVFYAQVFSLSLLFFPAVLFGETLKAHAKERELYVINIAANVMKIVLLLVLLPIYGIWGAITSIFFSKVAKHITQYVFFNLKIN